jgi:iron complex outermembrane receptor protein
MRKQLVTTILCFGFLLTLAQKSITGKIKDARTGTPLSNVSVKVKGASKGTSTNNQGEFTLSANTDDILEISSIGYASQTLTLTEGAAPLILLEPATTELTQVVFVGSRGLPRSKTESPVPVDVINVNNISSLTGKPDLMSQLNMSVPSFNYNKQSGGDGSDAIDFASLRGLGFDQTLVLVNGKRRHLSAFVNQVGTRGRGNSGTDLNAIPEAAIDRIEILRDGASAQYGSDAIAGVVNIILKKDVNHLNINIGGSGYYDHKYNTLNNVDPSQYYKGSQIDGKTLTVGLDYGIKLGNNGGYLNLGGNFMDQGKTFRAVPDTNFTTNPDALPVDKWRRAFGDGSVRSGGGMYNLEIPLAGTGTKFYSFGGYNYKHSNVYAWTRSWGVNGRSQPSKFPTDGQGNLIFVPGIMQILNSGDGTIGPNNVYYNPQEDVYIKDQSMAIGFKGTIGNGWDWDISNNLGYNDFHYWGNKTFNAALPLPYQATKNRFDDGGFNFLQSTANLDVTRHFSSVASGLTFSFGAEFRYEKYKLYAGEPDSYGGTAYDVYPSGDTLYKATGSEGYPGYQPSDAVKAHRTNVGGYVDLALDVTPEWLIDGAARFENYSDFGFVNTYKLATRYKLTRNFNLRGSFSSGFRAPSLQQINFSNTNTNIINGQLVYAKQVPNYSEVSKEAGIPALKQETSINGSLGFSWLPMKNLTVTVDGYWIRIKNRIVISGQYEAGDPTLGTGLNDLLASQGIQYAQFFANAVNTTNKGVDIVLDYTKRWGSQHFKALLAGNIQTIDINKINIPNTFKGSPGDSANFFSVREQYFLKASAPKSKFSLALEYGIKSFSVGTHLTYFGHLQTTGFGETATPASSHNPFFPYVTLDKTGEPVPEIFDFKAKVTTDLYASCKVSKAVTWIIGVDNIFNVHPNKAITPGSVSLATGSSSWGDSESGGPFDPVQMGFNGMRMFSRLTFSF